MKTKQNGKMKNGNALLALSVVCAMALAGCGGGGGASGGANATDSGTTVASGSYSGCAVLDTSLIASGECGTVTCASGTTTVGTYNTEAECQNAVSVWKAQWSPSEDNVANGAENANAVAILNEIRQQAGLPILKTNVKLEQAGTNHANYARDIFTTYNVPVNHYEYETEYPSIYFTGAHPYDRAVYVGYAIDSYVGEAMTYGSIDPQASIDELMSAIYHRNGLLFNFVDEIGIGISSTETGKHAYTYELASETAKQETLRKISPLIVAYPSAGSTDIRRVFYSEYPQPIENGGMSGYPISIEFNSYYTTTVELTYFRLYDENNVEITDTTLMDEQTDPNDLLLYNQFVLFPMQVLEASHTYRVEVGYVLNGEAGTKGWSFTTREAVTPQATLKRG